GVEYLLAAEPEVPDDAGRVEICHILTTDPGYVSPEGLRVGDTLERMREVLAEDGIAFNAGCAALPSGWNACFGGAAGTLPPGEGGLWPPDATITRFWK
ncbi:MAG: hypothetical protein GWO24_10780, partial [Akkermansiaceae bacterium]|nr:hypothetical protein [Akkermansiaceae bacterium]